MFIVFAYCPDLWNKSRICGKMSSMKEGRRVKSLDPFTTIVPYIMVERSDSQNTINECFDVKGVEALIRRLRHEGYDSIGVLHIIIAAYVRTISQRPAINRYIRGQKIYARNGIVINMAVKKKMSLDGQETTIKLVLNPSDTLFDVYDKVNNALKEVYEGDEGGVDAAARIVGYIPGLFKKFAIWVLKTADYFGLLPSALTAVSPFHGSLFITNMASLNIPPIKHHLYNFGNVPVFLAFGAKRAELVLNEDGSVDRKAFGPVVFSDKAKLGTLNSITHPWMVEKTMEMTREAEKNGKIAVINAALLESMGFVKSCDTVILVTAPYSVRERRAYERNGLGSDEFRKRAEAQKDIGLSLFSSGRPLITIINDGDIDSLSRQVTFLCDTI